MPTKKNLSPLSAIRKHCLECVGQCREEVRTCTGTDCPLWPFRFGTNPNRKSMSETEKAKRGQIMNRRRESK